VILKPPQTSALQEHQYLANGKRQELSKKKKKKLDIFTPLHLFTQSSKNLEKYVKEGL
jgi:hypothetical protein